MPYIELAVTIAVVSALAFLADLLAGRREMPAFFIVAYTGAICGVFLVLRVFALVTLDSWIWPVWAAGGAIVGLLLYFIFRKKR